MNTQRAINKNSEFAGVAANMNLSVDEQRYRAREALEKLAQRKADPADTTSDVDLVAVKTGIRQMFGAIAEVVELEMLSDSRICSLTKIFNRVGLLTPLTQEINELKAEKENKQQADTQPEGEQKRHSRQGKSYLLMIDLDRFKPINDIYGHAAGDAALVAVAEMLQKSFRETDTVSRYGGDEFLILVKDLSPTDVELSDDSKQTPIEVVKEKLEHALNNFSFEYEGQNITLGGTVGEFEIDPDLSASDNIKIVDKAMMDKKAPNMRGHEQQSTWQSMTSRVMNFVRNFTPQ